MTHVTIKTFEAEIDPKILERGKKYFRQGKVHEFEERDEEEFVAIIEGTEAYETSIKLDGGNIVHHLCDCPYDLGEFCKHEVALFYAISQYKNQVAYGTWNGEFDTVEPIRTKSGKPRKKRKTIADELKTAVEGIVHEKLKQIVLDYAKEDRFFRQIIFRNAPVDPDMDLKELYKKQINEGIKACSTHGFVDYGNAWSAIRPAQELLTHADKSISNKSYRMAFNAVQAVIETVYKWLGSVDDSDGSFGSAIEGAWVIFKELVDQIPKENPLTEEMFKWCLSQVGKKEYEGWSVHTNFFDKAILLAVNDQEEQELKNAIDKYEEYCIEKSEEDDSDWWKEHTMADLANLRVQLALARSKNKEAEELMEKYLEYHKVRERYLELLLKRKNYDRAKLVAKNGVTLGNNQGYLGIVHTFEQWLEKIAQEENDKETVREIRMRHFLDRPDMELYERLREVYDEKEWKDEYEKILDYLNDKRFSSYTILDIFIREEQWDRFLKEFKKECEEEPMFSYTKSGNISLVEHYENVIKEHFPNELMPFYEQALRQALVNVAGRKHYQYLCRVMRRMRKMGGEDSVERLRSHIEDVYGNRKALLDEVGRV